MLTWNNSGRVGINNVSPQQALNVTGTARAQQFTYAAPQTRYLSTPLDAFTSTNESAYKIFTGVVPSLGGYFPAYISLTGGTAGQEGFISAPVNLPQGATITNMELIGEDNDGTSVTPQLTLSALNIVAGSINLSVPLNANISFTTESPNWQTASLALNHIVRNDLNMYKIAVKLNQNSTETRVHGVRITYTVSNPN